MQPISKRPLVNQLKFFGETLDPDQFSAPIRSNRVLYEVASGKMKLQQTPGKTEGMPIIQSYLKGIGHDVNIAGIFDQKTRLAIEDFQRTNGILVTGNIDQETLHSLSKKFLATDLRPAYIETAYVETDMTNGTTTFDPRPEDPDDEPFTIETRNDVVPGVEAGADDEFETDDVDKRVRNDNPEAYGPPGAYIETDDPRGRDIHGGGRCSAVPRGTRQNARQGWCPTEGCTRGQNEDVKAMADKIEDFKTRHPGVKIPYRRVKRNPSGQTSQE